MIHDTENHADKWFDGNGGVGLRPGILAFLQRNPDWRIIYHSGIQYGLTILSNDEREFPPEPIVPWSPGYGPGTELKEILASLGIEEKPNCDCKGKQAQMDKWGVEECKKNRQTIIQWMREGSERWGYAEHLRTIASNVFNPAAYGLALKVNWIDPFPGLVDEAIRRAEAKSPPPQVVKRGGSDILPPVRDDDPTHDQT